MSIKFVEPNQQDSSREAQSLLSAIKRYQLINYFQISQQYVVSNLVARLFKKAVSHKVGCFNYDSCSYFASSPTNKKSVFQLGSQWNGLLFSQRQLRDFTLPKWEISSRLPPSHLCLAAELISIENYLLIYHYSHFVVNNRSRRNQTKINVIYCWELKTENNFNSVQQSNL